MGRILIGLMLGSTLLQSCMIQLGGGGPPDPMVPQYELIVQTQKEYIPKLEHDYRRYYLQHIKPLSQNMDIHLFGISPGQQSLDEVLQVMRHDVRITRVEKNHEIRQR